VGPLPVRNDYTRAPGNDDVVDVHETPAVPPEDPGGDERLGYYVAGGLLILLGWGGGVVANLLAHWMAGSAGMTIGWIRITSSMGSYAWAVLGFGLFAGAVGVVLVGLGRASPSGPFVLPGYNY
jgi:hypothetical protein